MTFTYDPNGTVNTDLARVRTEIQDTNSAAPLLSDEQIAYFLTEEGSVIAASARACEAIARRFLQDFDFTVDGDDVNRTKRAELYQAMAQTFRKQARSSIVTASTITRDGYQTTGVRVSHSDNLDADHWL